MLRAKVRASQLYVRDYAAAVSLRHRTLGHRRSIKANDKRKAPYGVLSVGPEYLKIFQEVVGNTVSNSRVTYVTQEGEASNQPLTRFTAPKPASPLPANEQSTKKTTQFAMKRIGCHVITKWDLHYAVRRYGYRSIDDTVKHPEHFGEELIRC